MRKPPRVHHADRWVLPIGLGLSDGILNALVLASGAVLNSGRGGVTVGLAARVAIVALLTALFTMFVAEYAQLRVELVRAEHELSLTTSGRLAATRLGHTVLVEASQTAAAAGACSFVGSLLPLVVAAAWPSVSWIALLLGVAALGGLGAVIARAVLGSTLRWTVIMTLGGVIVTAIGVQLNIT